MKLICINCPRGCELAVEGDGDGLRVSGNGCPRGLAYAEAEVRNPTRVVTALVRVAGIRRPLPVKTLSPVPKGKIPEILGILGTTTVHIPVRIGDVIVPDIANTGVAVAATANMG